MLQELYMHGFKSFAEPVTVDFSDSSVTAIVGPNGSGKSNIVDAIRWVMGEQSPTTLRSSKMSDVIFSGSEERAAREKAEVSLKLDNSDNQLSPERDEITLGRKVDTEGSSSYFLNNDTCRLKDIRNLLDDTGLNQEPYSVVGQNRVEAIINSSPEKLREIFEEAAKISRHRRRKEEAERRLERTEEDLQRVDDLIAEIENRLEPLEKEAKKARKYKSIYAEMKELEGSYLVASHRENRQQLKEYREKKQELETLKEKSEEELKQQKQEFSQLQNKREDLQEEIDNISSQLFQEQTRLQEISKNLDVLEERENNTEEKLERIQQQKYKLEKQQEQLQKNLNELNSKKHKNSKKAAAQRQLQQEILAHWQNLQREKSIISSRIDKAQRAGKEKQQQKLSQKVAALEERKQSLTSLTEELKQDHKKVARKIRSLQEKLDNFQDKRETYQEKLTNFQQKREKAEKDLNRVQKKINKYQDRLNKIKQQYSRCRSRWQARRRMQKQAQGYYSGVKAVMQADNLSGIIGPVARLIEVQEKFETAIAAVLGSRLQQLVVENTEAARKAINFLKEEEAGRATFLPLDMIEGNKLDPARYNFQQDSGYIAQAPEVVHFNDEIENIIYYLLGRVVISEEMKSAVRISRSTNSSCKIVTLEGELVNPGGSMSGGTRQQKSTILLSRSRQKRELAEKAAKMRQKMNNLQDSLAEFKDKLAGHQQKLESIENEISAVKEKSRENKENMREINRQLENLSDRQQELKQKAETKKKNKEELVESIEVLKSRLQRLDQQDQRHQDRINILQQNFQELKNQIEELNHLLQNSRLNLTKFQEKISSINEDISQLKQSLDSNSSQQEELVKEIAENKDELEKIDQRRQKLKAKRDKAQTRQKQLESEKENLQEELSQCKKLYSRRENKLENYREEKSEAEKELHSMQLKIGKLESKQERIINRLKDKYDLTIAEAKEEFSPDDQEGDPREKISQLEKELKQLGEVNLGAVDEYERLNSRHEFLQEEREDLLSARSSINGVIEELEEKMSEMFRETFEQVNKEFQDTFARLFRGGEAELELTDPENPLETGVDITARPPGKRLKRLSLLSGGEKALTAIALLFAFLEVNPSPIYVLDEIDSSLDDANLDMFAEFIKEYSQYSQFIIVTHRKRLMAIADTVYGVTMSKNGVSRLVSIQYDKQMAREQAQ